MTTYTITLDEDEVTAFENVVHAGLASELELHERKVGRKVARRLNAIQVRRGNK